MSKAKKGAGGSVYPTNMYGGAEIQKAAKEYGHATLSHVPDAIRERIQDLRDQGFEVLADEIYDQYTEEAG
jgi:predicted nucleotide-binding protein (sugar kinase/HSP70/actin superfamily)